MRRVQAARASLAQGLTQSVASKFEPAAMSRCTTLTCPWSTAKCSGVCLRCAKAVRTAVLRPAAGPPHRREEYASRSAASAAAPGPPIPRSTDRPSRPIHRPRSVLARLHPLQGVAGSGRHALSGRPRAEASIPGRLESPCPRRQRRGPGRPGCRLPPPLAAGPAIQGRPSGGSRL